MTQSQTYEGTPEQLAKFLSRLPLQKYRITVTPEETGAQSNDSEVQEAARIAAIDAAMGSMAHIGVTVEDLHRERRADDSIAERQLQEYKP